MNDEEIKDLIKRVQDKDQEGFVLLYKKTKAYVYKCLDNLGVRKCDHEDIVQMVFIDVYEKLNQLQDERCYFKWLYMVSRSNARRFTHKFYRIKTVDYDAIREVQYIETQKTPKYEFYNTMQKEAAHRLFQHMRVEYATILTLRYLREMTMEEIATYCKIPLGTVKSRLYQARHRLRSKPYVQTYHHYL